MLCTNKALTYLVAVRCVHFDCTILRFILNAVLKPLLSSLHAVQHYN